MKRLQPKIRGIYPLIASLLLVTTFVAAGDEDFFRGRQLFLSGDSRMSREIFQELTSTSNSFRGDSWYYLARLAYQEGELFEAADAYELSRRYGLRTVSRVDATYFEAINLASLAKPEEGLRLLEQIPPPASATSTGSGRAFQPGASEVWSSMVYMAGAAGYDDDQIIALLDALVNRLSETEYHEYLYQKFAQQLYEMGKYEMLITRYKQSAAGEDSRLVTYLYAESLYKTGDEAAAEAEFLALLPVNDELSPVVYSRLFDIYRENEDEARVNSILTRAERQLRDNPVVLIDFWERMLADRYRRGQYPDAWLYAAKLDQFEPMQTSYITPYYRSLLISRDDPALALETINSYRTEGGSDSPWLDIAAAGYQYRLGKQQDAMNTLVDMSTEGLELEGQQQRYYLLAALHLQNNGRPDARSARKSLEVLDLLEQTYISSGERLPDRYLLLAAKAEAGTGAHRNSAELYAQYLESHSGDADHTAEYLEQLLEAGANSQIASRYYTSGRNAAVLDHRIAFITGQALLKTGDYDSALEIFEHLSAEGSGEIQIFSSYYLGWTYYRMGEDEKALENYRLAITGNIASTLAIRARYEAAWAALHLGRYQTGLEFLGVAPGITGGKAADDLDFQSAYLRARLQELANHPADAANEYLALWRRDPRADDAAAVYLDYARLQIRQGNTSGANGVLEEIHTLYRGQEAAGTALLLLGDLTYKNSDWRGAKSAYNRFRREFPDASQGDTALYWLGMSSLRLEEPAAALLNFRTLLEEYPASFFTPSVLPELGALLAQMGSNEEAMEAYRRLQNEYPGQAEVYASAISALERKMGTSGAGSEAQVLAVLASDSQLNRQVSRNRLLELAADVVENRGGNSDSLAEIDEYLETLSVVSDAEQAGLALYYRGRLALYDQRYQDAAGLFLDAAVAAPDSVENASRALYFAMESYTLLGRQESGRQIYRRLMEVYPDSSWAGRAEGFAQKQEWTL